MCRNCQPCLTHIRYLQGSGTEQKRRKELFGHETALNLQGRISDLKPQSKFSQEQAGTPEQAARQASRLTEAQRRRQLFGHAAPLNLQGGVNESNSYPTQTPIPEVKTELDRQNKEFTESYPQQEPIEPADPNEAKKNQTRFLETESARERMFGYSRNLKGEKVPYAQVVKELDALWKCPSCGCEWPSRKI